MRILIISHLFPRPNKVTYGTFVWQWAKALTRLGINPIVVSPVPLAISPFSKLSKKWKEYSDIPDKFIYDSIETFYPRYVVFPKEILLSTAGFRMNYGIKSLISNLFNKYQFYIIHAHVPFPDGYIAKILKDKYHVPYVVTNHSCPLFDRNYIMNKRIQEVFHSSDGQIFVSSKVMNKAMELFDQPNNISIIHNGIDPNLIKHVSVNGFHDSSKQYIKILSVSRLVETKGIDLNIIAISHLVKKYNFLKYSIIGDGPERKRLEKMVIKYGLLNHVKFLGTLPIDDVMRHMAGCHIFSLPSWSEGLGVVYLEAMAHGKPVIACQGEGIEDIIDDTKNGYLVKPKDVESLISTLQQCIENIDKMNVLGQNAKDLILSKYTWADSARKTLNLYNNIIN